VKDPEFLGSRRGFVLAEPNSRRSIRIGFECANGTGREGSSVIEIGFVRAVAATQISSFQTSAPGVPAEVLDRVGRAVRCFESARVRMSADSAR